jgi:hypothetical protein
MRAGNKESSIDGFLKEAKKKNAARVGAGTKGTSSSCQDFQEQEERKSPTVQRGSPSGIERNPPG